MRGTHEGSCGARLPIPRLSREPSSPGEGLPCQLVPLAESWATPGPDKWAEARSGQNLANPACLCLRAPGPPVPSLDWVLGARRGSEGLRGAPFPWTLLSSQKVGLRPSARGSRVTRPRGEMCLQGSTFRSAECAPVCPPRPPGRVLPPPRTVLRGPQPGPLCPGLPPAC